MKKKHRDITVNDKPYGWTVATNYDGTKHVRIWENKKVIYDKDMSEIEVIEPSLIAKIINKKFK
jgi:hypothetical protein